MFPLFSTHFSQMGEKKFNQKTPIFLSNYAIVSKNQDQQHRQEGTQSEETRGLPAPWTESYPLGNLPLK